MKDVTEYLRRNLLHAKAVGAHATMVKAWDRLALHSRPPKWLLAMLEAAIARAAELPKELAKHRDEMAC